MVVDYLLFLFRIAKKQKTPGRKGLIRPLKADTFSNRRRGTVAICSALSCRTAMWYSSATVNWAIELCCTPLVQVVF